MAEFEVTVITQVKEIYSVTADSAEEATERWQSGDLVSSECIAIDDLRDAVEVEG